MIERSIVEALSASSVSQGNQRMNRTLRSFLSPTEVTFIEDQNRNLTIMELSSPDRPGLLARVGQIMADNQISIQGAKIQTLGERVEDVFFLTTDQGDRLADDTICERTTRASMHSSRSRTSGMNPGMNTLHPYPFEKLAELTSGVDLPSLSRIPLTIGEPKHQPPAHVLEALVASIEEMAKYPTIVGTVELRQQIASWIARRFKTRAVDPVSEVLPVNGTREGLFAIAQALVTPGKAGGVVIPNPFYQIYEGAALLANVEPLLVPATESTEHLANYRLLTDDDWQRCEMLFLCTPGNPSGAVIPETDLHYLIEKSARARRDFDQ